MLTVQSFLGRTLGGDAQVVISKDVREDMAILYVPDAYISSFEDLIPRNPKPRGAPSRYYFPAVAQHVISTMLSNLMVQTEVPYMVWVINEAFKCLNVFNLDLRRVYKKVFDF